MVRVHSGVVRGRSRKDKCMVKYIDVFHDNQKIEIIRKEFENRLAIDKGVTEEKSGRLKHRDELLFIRVADDVKEKVKPVLSGRHEHLRNDKVGFVCF